MKWFQDLESDIQTLVLTSAIVSVIAAAAIVHSIDETSRIVALSNNPEALNIYLESR